MFIPHIFFIHLSVNGHLGCIHVLAIIKVLLWTLGCMYHFELEFCLDICSGVGSLDHMQASITLDYSHIHNAEIICSALCFCCTRFSLFLSPISWIISCLRLGAEQSLKDWASTSTHLSKYFQYRSLLQRSRCLMSHAPLRSQPHRISKSPLSLWVDTKSLSLNMPFANRLEGWV